MLQKNVLSSVPILFIIVGASIAAFTFHVSAQSGIIYVRLDGSIDPPTAPISSADNSTYVFTDDTSCPIVIERSNILVDGKDHRVCCPNALGTVTTIAILVSGARNVTITNFEIKGFFAGIRSSDSSYINVTGNIITGNYNDAVAFGPYHNCVMGNNITNNNYGIMSFGSNSIHSNNLMNNTYGVYIELTDHESVYGNNITNNINGVVLSSSSNNRVIGNNITDNERGLMLWSSFNTSIFHNNIVDNTVQHASHNSLNLWDDDYPSGGNYWSDYSGVDEKSGPNQDQPESDGMGDTPYALDVFNKDRYPLMSPQSTQDVHDVAITSIYAHRTVLGNNATTSITVTVQNEGDTDESFDVTVHYNSSILMRQNLFLAGQTATNLTCLWSTTNLPLGKYVIRAEADKVSGEKDVADNTLTYDVKVSIPGDINGDWKVNIVDISLATKAYESSPADSRWIANADLDENNYINILDISTIAKEFGKAA